MLADINGFWLCQYFKGKPAWSDRILLARYAHFIPCVWDFHVWLKLWEDLLNLTQGLQNMASSCHMFCPV